MNISQLIEAIGETKSEANKLYKAYKELSDKEVAYKSELQIKLTEMGLKSAKGDKYSASIAQRSNIQITHEQSAIDWLNNEPNIETDQFIGLKTTEFKKLALYRLSEKGGGEIIPGTEMVMSESLSVKANKET